jgi:hypothetical protein
MNSGNGINFISWQVGKRGDKKQPDLLFVDAAPKPNILLGRNGFFLPCTRELGRSMNLFSTKGIYN